MTTKKKKPQQRRWYDGRAEVKITPRRALPNLTARGLAETARREAVADRVAEIIARCGLRDVSKATLAPPVRFTNDALDGYAASPVARHDESDEPPSIWSKSKPAKKRAQVSS